jgi:glutamine cyclotransferase
MARRTVPLAAVSLVMVLLAAVVVSCGERERACDGAVPVPQKLVPEVVRTVPHAMDAFTEGLLVRDGKIYESTGLEGRSSLRVLDLQTGAEQRRAELPPNLFGEGLAEGPGGTLVQLTWKNRTALVWDRATLRQTGTLRYRGEGWGITTVPSGDFVMSNGSDRLRYLDPKTFHVWRELSVSINGEPVNHLNELEFIEGEIFANVWHTDRIVRINPKDGNVIGVIDLSGIDAKEKRRDPEHVLNGIAYDPKTGEMFVTGKCWPKIYQIQLVPKK